MPGLVPGISFRHCERSEAIHLWKTGMDCFVAALLAMTKVGHPDLLHGASLSVAKSSNHGLRSPAMHAAIIRDAKGSTTSSNHVCSAACRPHT